MRHFSSERWADYVRGTAPKADRAEMKRHLDSGCRKCRKVAAMWQNTLKMAQREASYQPPESSVRFVKGCFALAGPRRNLPATTRIAQLVFDTFRQPQLAGVRSLEFSARHLVYQAGPMLVDLRLEEAREAPGVSLAGQVLDQSSPDLPFKAVPVSVRSGRKDIVSTTTNQFGEFHFELAPKLESDLLLSIGSEDKAPIIIPLRVFSGVKEGAKKPAKI